MFDNGSFLRRRKRYKRASLNHNMPFANVFAPFTPFWIRKPVPVLPAAMQFSSMHHHSAGHHQHAHHQSFNANCNSFNRDTFNLMNFQRTASALPTETDSDHKAFLKKQFYDSPSIQSIKSELFHNNNNPGASKNLFGIPEDPNNSNSYDEDFNNDNIDVESDSDDQMILKQEMNFSLDRNLRKSEDKEDEEMMAKNEEWNRIMKNTMLSNEFKPSFPLTSNLNRNLEISKLSPSPTDLSKNSKKRSMSPLPVKILSSTEDLEAQILAKKIYQTNPKDENPFYSESLTEQLNMAERKRGKYGNAKGFSIENLIGRIVEDR